MNGGNSTAEESPLLWADKGGAAGTSLSVLTPQLNAQVTREHHQFLRLINKSSYHIYRLKKKKCGIGYFTNLCKFNTDL